ncbi:response regulator, partial [bacterium]|nr:response regulator [bacterium]
LRKKDGTFLLCEVEARCIQIENEKLRVTAFRDITERKQAEEQIKTSLKVKETLLKEIHHRVKNNMQIIISMLNLQKDYQKESGTVDLNDTINRVRLFGEVHRKLYLREDIAKIDFVQHLKDSLKELIVAYNVNKEDIKLELDLPETLFELDQAISCGLLMNELISNSLKHAFQDKGRIKISILQDTDGELEKIVYEDTGKGMKNSKQGFGSKIISALADQMDLSFKVSSDNGTRYEFIKKKSDQLIETSTEEILFVEDEVLIAMDRIADLKQAGYSVNESVITTGEKAVSFVRNASQKPSLILMDIKLKGKINGLEASLEIRKEYPQIPIIFVSGYEDPQHAKQIAAIPNSSYLNKMCLPEEIKKEIDSYLK